MYLLKYSLMIVGILFLCACSGGNQVAITEKAPVSSVSPVAKIKGEHGKSHGGEIVETGAYHLEFVPEVEANRIHLDLYLQRGDNHEAIPNAKVTAQVQLPDGTQKPVNFSYDAKDKHYTGLLSTQATGQYQVKINADVKGEKVSGRFSFKK